MCISLLKNQQMIEERTFITKTESLISSNKSAFNQMNRRQIKQDF